MNTNYFPPEFISFIALLYGCVGFLILIPFAFHLNFYFKSIDYDGYIYENALPKFFVSELGSKILVISWMICLICLAIGFYPIVFAGFNYLLCHIYFVKLRWVSLNRGFGATGFLMNWLGMAVWLMLVISLPGVSATTQHIALYFVQVDFALIMISAGVYKLLSGYFRGEGIEYALVNPMWAYFGKGYAKISPNHWLFKFMNHNTWFWELVAGVMMLCPPTMPVGAAIIALSFVFVGFHFRLNFLPALIFICCCFYVPEHLTFSRVDAFTYVADLPKLNVEISDIFDRCFFAVIAGSFVLMLLTHVCLWIQFFNKNKPTAGIVRALNVYANYVGIVIWRVFTADISNFIVQVYAVSRTGERYLLSNYGRIPNLLGGRYSNTIESVTLACIFNTLKYQPSDYESFHKKIRAYGNSVSRIHGPKIIFQIEKIEKSQGFGMRKSAEFIYDKKTHVIESVIYNKEWAQPAKHSLTKPTSKPGSYGSSS